MIKEIKEKLVNAGRWIKRKIKEVLIALGIIGIALAMTQMPADVSLAYKNNNMTIEFINNDMVMGQALLKSHKTYDEVLEIPSGEDRTVIWYEFSGFDSVKMNALKGVEFLDMKEKIEKIIDESEFELEENYEISSIPNPNYLLPITKEYRFVYLKDDEWVPYNSFDIPKENIIIGVQTDLGWGEYLDVVLNVMGNKLDRHAIVLGTSSGFVTEAPEDDPTDTIQMQSIYANVTHDTSPATAGKITEIGWWCDGATQEANFEVGLYAADGATVPGEAGTLLEVSRTNAKGTTAGWKRVIVNWSISASTPYWLGVQLDTTSPATYIDRKLSGGSGFDTKWNQSTLPNPFGGGALSDADGMMAIYAVWEVEAPPSRRIMIIE